MADELVNMGNQFSGLDMASLIGGPLKAACDAQKMLSASTATFIESVGMETDENGNKKVRTTQFSFTRAAQGKDGADIGTEEVMMNVPILSMVNVPSLAVEDVNISFDMEVKSATSQESVSDKKGELEANAGLKIGPFHMDVKIKGSVSCHESNTRSSDNSAKYHVEVRAKQAKQPEGLSRMLDMLASAAAPVAVKNQSTPDTPAPTPSPETPDQEAAA